MKKLLFYSLLLFTVLSNTYSQNSPTLQLTGTNPALVKGNINTEVLTAIIQKKQEEIKQRVFRNTIVKQFKDPGNNYTKKLNNITTFNYLYNLMDVLTSGKNKTVMTKAVIESSAEFAFIFGMALYHNDQVINDSKVSYTIKGKIDIPKQKVSEFNLLIDICYDIVLTNRELFQNAFKFDESLKNTSFERWYNSDNVFVLEMKKAKDNRDQNRIDFLNSKRQQVKEDIDRILKFANQATLTIESLELSDNPSLKEIARKLENKISTLSGQEVEDEMKKIKTNFGDALSEQQIEKIDAFIDLVGVNFDQYKQLYSFYTGLKKSKFRDFTLSREQYYALKYILLEFIDVAKNQYPNDAISTVLEFLLENTLVEYHDNNGNLVTEGSEKKEMGYLFVDIESVISTIDSRFNSITKKGFGVYLAPFFNIGTNYASFNQTNELLTNSDGTTNSLGNLYFASEKIGIRWKLWNWEYTHSFRAGESIKYYGRKTYWKRPQEEPLISNVHILAYGSGLLYNLVDLKSEEGFNAAIVGAGFGITFFNGLSTGLSLASPVIDKEISSQNSFLNFSIDIPIIEYIGALSKKND